jgi:glycosyltransferase involved in cell wall biosynthesis
MTFVPSYRPRLRILIDPVYVQISNLSGSSTYRKYVTLVRELVKRGHYVYWCVPDSEYTPDEIENHPHVGIIRTSAIQDQFVVDGLITDEFFNLFNRVAGKYHVDVLCTSRNSLAAHYKRLLEPPRFHDNDGNYTDKGYGLPVVLIEEFPQTQARQNSGEAYWLAQCLGYLASDKTVFLSGHNRSEVVKEMAEIFVTSRVRNFVEHQAHVIPAGIETEQLDTVYDPDRWKAETGFQVVSIGRIMGVSYAEYLPWFDYLFKSGLSDARLTVSLSGALGGPMRKKLEKIGFDWSNVGKQFRILENNNRANFIRQLRGYHAFVAPMSHLDHPTGIFEAVYMGLPGVMPVADYQQTFFRDWPWVIEPKDKASLIGHLMWIRENKEEARRMVLPWRDRIRELYNAKDKIGETCDVIEGSARSHVNRFKTSGAVINFAKELKGKKYTFPDVVAFLQKQGFMGVSIGDMSIRTTFTYARSAIHHTMGLAGFVDACDGPDDLFVRRDVFDAEYLPRTGDIPAIPLIEDERIAEEALQVPASLKKPSPLKGIKRRAAGAKP